MGKRKMNDEELHFLGIKAVYKEMIDQGHKVLNVRKELDVNPQILAEIDGKRSMIVVKTARFPDMGVMLPELMAKLKVLAKKHEAQLYFASVGIAKADGEHDAEMAFPEVDGEYYINYKGLTQIQV